MAGRGFHEVAASFPTNFAAILHSCPPPLMRGNEGTVSSFTQDKQQNKVEVYLRVCPIQSTESSSSSSSTPTTAPAATTTTSILECNETDVHIKEPDNLTTTKSTTHKKLSKTFHFNAVFNQDSTMLEICSRTLSSIIHSAVTGTDACLFSYGHARLGKTYTMLGLDDRPDLFGIIPCSISWLFLVLDELKKSTGFRYSVRVSALEVTGRHEDVKDLLSDSFASAEAHSMPSTDPLDAMKSRVAPTPEHAALFLDAAIAARTISDDNERRNSHFLYTMHVFQQRFDGSQEKESCLNSRIHLLVLGSCCRHKDSCNSMSLSELGNVFFALLSGKKLLSHCDSKLSQLLKRIFSSSPNIVTCMVAHVSPTIKSYHQTLQVLHLASQIQRSSAKRRTRNSIPNGVSPSSPGSSTKGSDIDYSSSSEQSVDTVIFVAKKASDFKQTPLQPQALIQVPNKAIPPRPKIYQKNLSNIRKSIDPLSLEAESQAKVHKKAPPKTIDEINSSPIIGRCQPQGREVTHSFYEGSKPVQTNEDNDKLAKIEICRELLKDNKLILTESNGELWIDGPGKGLSEHWIDGPQEFWTTPCPGIHGLKSPKIKKLYSALKHKHQQMCSTESGHKITRCFAPNTESEQQCATEKQQQSQFHQTLQDEKYFVTASPDITAFHNFFEKHKQDLIHQKFSLPSDSHFNDFEDFLQADNCYCKCHVKNDCKNAQPKSPKHPNTSKENKHPKTKTDRTKAELGECIQDDRIADWVSSIQESGFSKFSQLLHSRKELIKSFQSPKNRHNLKPVLMEYFQNASPLATFDSPVITQECNSPPPDYDACMVDGHLDINDNQMTAQNDLQANNLEEAKLDCFFEECNPKIKTMVTSQARTSFKMCNGAANTSHAFQELVVRKLGPEGASCHSSNEESQVADHCSIHESLRRNRSKKANFAGRSNLKSSRNYSSSETIFVPNLENEDRPTHDILDRIPLHGLNLQRSPSKPFTSPKKERCSLAMALLSCAAKYRRKAEGAQIKSKPRNTPSAFCLGHNSSRAECSDASDAEFQELKHKHNLLVFHTVDGNKSTLHPPVPLKASAINRPPR